MKLDKEYRTCFFREVEYLKSTDNFIDDKTAKISYLLGLAYMIYKL